MYIPDDKWQIAYYPNTSQEFPWLMKGTYDDGTPAEIWSKEEWEQACTDHGQLIDAHVEYPNHEGDAAVFTRPLAWLASHMIEMKSQGIRVSAEVDDNYISAASLNAFMKKAGYDQNSRDEHMRSVASADALILSTEYLRDAYWKGLKDEFGKQHLPELFVCRNHVDSRFVPEVLVPRRSDGTLRIGYMGSDSHIWDIDLIYDALLWAYRAGHEVVFVGVDPRNSPAALNSKGRHDWGALGYTHVPWSNDYRGKALPLDIGFAPLLVNNHTLGKSDIKWLEYAMSGAACIAQNCLVYNRTASHGETALLAGSPSEYVDKLKVLTEGRDAEGLRKSLVDNTWQYINAERLLENNAQEWKDAVFG